ncbi:nuclear transcription factor Y subunit B-9-like [Abrus precatorius]|uniref:Nuclear transcription factor Y subunit B-9-like n=1 Tax=Abrus precatorius TaxID=3816 RepID=A0A8B8M5J8_ABRPR|nr:nuclear transcription factor Y subunit B-9-like [Abrus precatorius]
MAGVREQDQYMPIANVIRIMRRTLPPHAKISDDAKETIQECVSEYISFITAEANDRCQREQRKTVTAEDVLWAMAKLGFDDYVHPLSLYLHRYRENEGEHASARRASASIHPPPQPPPPLYSQAFGMLDIDPSQGLYGDDASATATASASASASAPYVPTFDPYPYINRDTLQ